MILCLPCRVRISSLTPVGGWRPPEQPGCSHGVSTFVNRALNVSQSDNNVKQNRIGMAGNATVTIRVDPGLKRAAAEAAEGYGLDLSTATRLFYAQMVNTNALPITFDYRRPNAESREAIAQVREIIARSGTGRFATANDMIAKLGLSLDGSPRTRKHPLLQV